MAVAYQPATLESEDDRMRGVSIQEHSIQVWHYVNLSSSRMP